MLQHGMNFRVTPDHSVILMSRRPGAPYNDSVIDGGKTLLYEGHDLPRTSGIRDPKQFDQPRTTTSGRLTPNGKFHEAALRSKAGQPPELVRVYEKIKDGIWTYNGVFQLVDAWQERSGRRNVFKFRLILTDIEIGSSPRPVQGDLPHNRLIPAAVKREVYQRDKGKCVICGSGDNLHFDHDFPFSKGGTSITAKNIRLLCARHNLQKHDKIE
ncbi:MAG: HNH endonuclease [Terriglobales bacterium]